MLYSGGLLVPKWRLLGRLVHSSGMKPYLGWDLGRFITSLAFCK